MSISVKNIAFSYDTVNVFHSISFDIPQGEIWALLGKSGIGKTTLLQIIAGLFAPKQGSVLINEKKALPGLIKGIVFQDDSLLGWLTVKKNLFFPKIHISGAENAFVDNLLKSVGLFGYADMYPKELSAGMKKRLEFARALMIDKEFILADEPFGTVDAVTRRNLWKLWLDLRITEPRTGILCTHDPEEALRLCDTVVTMAQGLNNVHISIQKVPDSIKILDIHQENSAFWEIKNKIIKSLEFDQNG